MCKIKQNGIELSGDICGINRCLQQPNVLPTCFSYSLASTVHHFRADIYADNLSLLTDCIMQQWKTQASAAGHIQDAVPGAQAELVDGARTQSHRALRRSIIALGMIAVLGHGPCRIGCFGTQSH